MSTQPPGCRSEPPLLTESGLLSCLSLSSQYGWENRSLWPPVGLIFIGRPWLVIGWPSILGRVLICPDSFIILGGAGLLPLSVQVLCILNILSLLLRSWVYACGYVSHVSVVTSIFPRASWHPLPVTFLWLDSPL
jgi:hypothetical protein